MLLFNTVTQHTGCARTCTLVPSLAGELWLRLGDAFRDETGQLLVICHTAGDEVKEQKKAKAWYRACVNTGMGPTNKL